MCQIASKIRVYVDRLIELYTARPKEIEWFILVDPSRQYNASLNPTIEEPEKWYGEHFRNEIEMDPIDETVIGLIDMFSTLSFKH
jgi:hypothetical protein